MPILVPAAAPGLPSARLFEIHDCLTLALDATERLTGYSASEREAGSYLRSALRRTGQLIAAQAGGAA